MSTINRLTSKISKTKDEIWTAFKGGLKIKGYEYY